MQDGDQLPDNLPAAHLSDVESAVVRTDQTELFDDIWPDVPAVVEAAKSYMHTGKAATDDEVLAQRIIGALMFGNSQRAVARQFHVSRNTVRRVVENMIASDKLEPIKQRVSGLFMDTSEMALEAFREMVSKHPEKIPPQVLSWAAVNFGKQASEMMGSGAQVLTPKGEASLATQVEEAFNACLRAASAIPVESVVTDFKSDGSTGKTLDIPAIQARCNDDATEAPSTMPADPPEVPEPGGGIDAPGGAEEGR